MNKNRFSDKRLSQISSTKELRATRYKVAVRLEILEDKFENGSWSLFNTESMLYNLTRKAAGIKGAWDSAKEIFQNLRGQRALTTPAPEPQEAGTSKPARKQRRRKAKANKSEAPTTTPATPPTLEAEAPQAETSEPTPADTPKEIKPKRRRRGGRRKPKSQAPQSEE